MTKVKTYQCRDCKKPVRCKGRCKDCREYMKQLQTNYSKLATKYPCVYKREYPR